MNGLNTIYKNGNNLKRKIKKESRKQKKGECFMITIKTAKKQKLKESKGITLIALVITIALNCSYLAMERKNRKEANKLKI